MNPACLLIPTGLMLTGATAARPGRVDGRQIDAGVAAGFTQTGLVVAGERRAVAQVRSRPADRRLRRRMSERP
jgi:hypothetical protein